MLSIMSDHRQLTPYFNSREFDSPDLEYSGLSISPSLVSMLDMARGIAQVPFIINSGVRTISHNKAIGGVDDSSHLKGLAVDIKIINSSSRFRIIRSLLVVGFRRVGIASNYIHCDIDYDKPLDVIWWYK